MYYDLYLVCDSKVNSIAHARGSSLSQSDLRCADQVFELFEETMRVNLFRVFFTLLK